MKMAQTDGTAELGRYVSTGRYLVCCVIKKRRYLRIKHVQRERERERLTILLMTDGLMFCLFKIYKGL